MSDEATIEDEQEDEHPSHSARPETKTGLLPWSYIIEMGKSFFYLVILFYFEFNLVSKQWAMFLIVSIAIGIFLYINGRRQQDKKSSSSAIRHDNVQGGSKGVARKSPKRD
jgi:hypothetical protein